MATVKTYGGGRGISFPIGICLTLLGWLAPASGQQRHLVDRIVAVVNNSVITQMDLDNASRLAGLGAETRATGKPQDLLNHLIEQRLMRRDIESLPGLETNQEQVKAHLAQLDSRYRSDGGLAGLAARWNLTLQEIEDEVRDQLRVKDFIDIRFNSSIIIGNEEIERYYRETLPEQLKQAGISQLPPLDSIRQQIHDTLKEQHLDIELNRWIEDLKRKAEVSILTEGFRFLPPQMDRLYNLAGSPPSSCSSGAVKP